MSAQSIGYGGKFRFAIEDSGLHALLAWDAKTMLRRQFIYWSISWLDFHSIFLTLTTRTTFATTLMTQGSRGTKSKEARGHNGHCLHSKHLEVMAPYYR